MNLENDDSVNATALGNNDFHSSNFAPSVGHVLRNARLARGLSTEDVSRQLRISVHQVEAIEKEDFDKLPGRTFLRGFVRNYANFIQLDPMPLLESLPGPAPTLAAQERTPLKNKQLSFSENRRDGFGSTHLITIVVFLLIAFGGYYIVENSTWFQRFFGEKTDKVAKTEVGKSSMEIQLPISGSTTNEKSLPVNSFPGSSSSEERRNNSLNIPKPLDTSTYKSASTIEIPQAINRKTEVFEEFKSTPENSATSDTGSLYFTFTSDSWVKVVDGKGVALLEQVRKKGSEQVITGKKPFSIVIGNAAGVELTYNDEEINISSYKKQDGTARFKLQ